jgi:hypothetical protein
MERELMKHVNKACLTGALSLLAFGATLALSPVANAKPYTHDGFYLQMDVGLGYLTTSAESGGASETLSGVTIPSALWLGGTVGPVVIGGGFFSDYAFSPSASFSGGASQTIDGLSMYLIGIGVFADYYIDPVKGGWHIQPFLGWGGLETSYKGNSGGSDPTGLVLAIGGGYDFWVASEWSIGVMGRLAYAPLKLNEVSYSTIAPAVLATFTYH